jgi:hypothetical protein
MELRRGAWLCQIKISSLARRFGLGWQGRSTRRVSTTVSADPSERSPDDLKSARDRASRAGPSVRRSAGFLPHGESRPAGYPFELIERQ